MEKLYRIEEFTTMGWELVEETAVKMPRKAAEERLNRLMEQGHNPGRLRVVIDNG